MIRKKTKSNNKTIEKLLDNSKGLSPKATTNYKKGDSIKEKYLLISADEALELIKIAYESFIARDDGICNKFSEMESTFLFSLSEWMQKGENKVALITRRGRKLAKMKRNGLVYQNAPDDGNVGGVFCTLLC